MIISPKALVAGSIHTHTHTPHIYILKQDCVNYFELRTIKDFSAIIKSETKPTFFLMLKLKTFSGSPESSNSEKKGA